MPFKAFEHNMWHDFFHAMRDDFHVPSTVSMDDDLLHLEYKNVMAEVMHNLEQSVMIYLALDGAMNVQGKQIINMMACRPMAFFLEHFSMKLCQKSVGNLYKKLIDCKLHLLLRIRELALGFVDHVVTSGACHNDADPQQIATLYDHFVGASTFMFGFDLALIMIKLCRLCI